MAQLLSDRNSANICLNTVKRHIRLCRQIKGAEVLATAIEPCYNDLVAKVAVIAQANEASDLKRDQVLLKDALLDDKVRDLFEACKKFERDNPGQLVTSLLFPDGLSSIIYAPLESEPGDVERLMIGIGNLGEGHLLAAHISLLQLAVDECKAALAEMKEALKAVKTAEAFEDISKMNLSRQYEQNLYAAESKFGKRYANRLFPAISTPKKEVTQEEKKE